MNKIIIQKNKVFGKIKIPSSKSYTHRALILAALSPGKSRIFYPLISDDTLITADCLEKIGVKIKKEKNFWQIEGGNLRKPKEILYCKESGTSLRLMTAVCSLIKGKCILSGEKSLLKRPIIPLIKALKNLGVKCSFKKNKILIENNFIGGETKIRGDISSQFISALLLIAPLAKKEMKINLTSELESKPYVLMTIEAQKKFGVKINYSKNLKNFFIKKQNYKPTDYFIEGDWSSASFFLAAGALTGKVEIKNLNPKSLQADRKIIEILKKMGAKIKIKKNSIIVEKSLLKAIKLDVSDCPDLFPIICVLATAANGKTKISGIKRLKLKESNRLEEMRKGLNKMGIKTKLITKKRKKFFIIESGKAIGGTIETNDHRIAMAFSILGLIAEGKTIIKNSQCVFKSFPQFFEILENLKN